MLNPRLGRASRAAQASAWFVFVLGWGMDWTNLRSLSFLRIARLFIPARYPHLENVLTTSRTTALPFAPPSNLPYTICTIVTMPAGVK